MKIYPENLREEVLRCMTHNDGLMLPHKLAQQEPATIAHLMKRVTLKQRVMVFNALDLETSIEVLNRLSASLQADLITNLAVQDATQIFSALTPDNRADLIDELSHSKSQQLLKSLSPWERELTQTVLRYPRGSIGRKMSPEYVVIDTTMTVEEAMGAVETQIENAESIYTLPVSDQKGHLIGVVSLRDLLRSSRRELVEHLMRTPDYVEVSDSAESAARFCSQQKHLAMPVVNEHQQLVGLLTVDDALKILEDAESEDQARMSGSEVLHRPYLATPVMEIVKARVVWLLVLAVGATLTVRVLETFEDTIAQVVVLSVFVPLLIGTGGNIGNQAATTVTRSLALGDMDPRDFLKVMMRELRVGLFLGIILGGLGFLVSSLIYGSHIGFVIGFSLLSICTLAATVGGLMPMVAKGLKIDPAVFSNPFITTLVDALGLIIYFLIAKTVLGI